MLTHLFHTQEQKICRYTTRVAAVLLASSAISVALMVVLIVNGSSWLIKNTPKNVSIGEVKASTQNASPLNTLQKLFVGTGMSTKNALQPVVLSEEAQTIEVVKQASPAVVSIIQSSDVPKIEQCNLNLTDPNFPNQPTFQVPSTCQNGTQKLRVGAGSGFVVSSDGYIMTNKHVVQDEKAEYTVVLNDALNLGKKISAKVIARDPDNDVAILKIDPQGKTLPFLKLGDSNKLQVGQTAIAIGYALGEFDNTVSKGVVSGLSRTLTASDVGNGTVAELHNLIQTDAAINPGNSGGPLLDTSGSVIGMSTALADGQSLGFAIPINIGKAAFDQVKASGTIVSQPKGFLGVRYVPITQLLTNNVPQPYDYGMLVIKGENAGEIAVVPNSPAALAGIVEGDIILEVNGHQLNERYLLSDALSQFKPGDFVTLKIYHAKAEKTISVQLAKRPTQ